MDAWWKQFRFIKKEEAIHAIDLRRNMEHGMREMQECHVTWNKYVFPILTNRRLWDKADVTVKRAVYRYVIDAIDLLLSNKLAKVKIIEDIVMPKDF